MRKIIVSMYTSLDGFIAGPNGEMDWIFKYANNETEKYSDDLINNVDLILLGRTLAEVFLDYWPKDSSDFAKKINALPKIIFSKTMVEPRWPNVTIISDNVAGEINKIKNQAGKDIVLYGGAEAVSSLTKLNLIDEYHLLVVPIVLSKGLHLFNDLNKNVELELMKTRAFDSGVVGLFYKRQK